MTFRIQCAKQIILNLTNYIRSHLQEESNAECGSIHAYRWETQIHVSGFWHFAIQYEYVNAIERFTIIHKKRNGHVIHVENGKITTHFGLKRFDMLFAALNDELIAQLSDGKTFKITKKKWKNAI